MKIVFRIEEDGELLEGGSKSLQCNGLDDITDTINQYLDDEDHKEIFSNYENKLEFDHDTDDTFTVSQKQGFEDRTLFCKIVGMTNEERVEVSGFEGPLF